MLGHETSQISAHFFRKMNMGNFKVSILRVESQNMSICPYVPIESTDDNSSLIICYEIKGAPFQCDNLWHVSMRQLVTSCDNSEWTGTTAPPTAQATKPQWSAVDSAETKIDRWKKLFGRIAVTFHLQVRQNSDSSDSVMHLVCMMTWIDMTWLTWYYVILRHYVHVR